MKNYVAGFFEISSQNKPGEIEMSRSKLMDKLYGAERSEKVYERLKYLDENLNHTIQTIAYDHFWALPGTTLKEKAIVTVSSLIALKKEEQTRIHMHGFLNVGGTNFELVMMAQYLETLCGTLSKEKALDAIRDVLIERGESTSTANEIISKSGINLSLPRDEEAIITLSAASALGDVKLMHEAIQQAINMGLEEKINHIFMHQIVYCGFPTAMNAFAELKNVLLTTSNDNTLRARL